MMNDCLCCHGSGVLLPAHIALPSSSLITHCSAAIRIVSFFKVQKRLMTPVIALQCDGCVLWGWFGGASQQECIVALICVQGKGGLDSWEV